MSPSADRYTITLSVRSVYTHLIHAKIYFNIEFNLAMHSTVYLAASVGFFSKASKGATNYLN